MFWWAIFYHKNECYGHNKRFQRDFQITIPVPSFCPVIKLIFIALSTMFQPRAITYCSFIDYKTIGRDSEKLQEVKRLLEKKSNVKNFVDIWLFVFAQYTVSKRGYFNAFNCWSIDLFILLFDWSQYFLMMNFYSTIENIKNHIVVFVTEKNLYRYLQW